MSLWKRTMDYLGLGPDDAYDDDIIEDDYDPAPRGRRPQEPDPRASRSGREETVGADGVVRTLPNARMAKRISVPAPRPPLSTASHRNAFGGTIRRWPSR